MYRHYIMLKIVYTIHQLKLKSVFVKNNSIKIL